MQECWSANVIAAPHNCKTMFVGGINPWGEYAPPELKADTKTSILDLLSDGIPRTSKEITSALGVSQANAESCLKRMRKAGFIRRDTRSTFMPRNGHLTVFVYSVIGLKQQERSDVATN